MTNILKISSVSFGVDVGKRKKLLKLLKLKNTKKRITE
jgi:hypothetical protein